MVTVTPNALNLMLAGILVLAALGVIEGILLFGLARRLLTDVAELLTMVRKMLARVPGKSAQRTDGADAVPTPDGARFPRLQVLGALRELARDVADDIRSADFEPEPAPEPVNAPLAAEPRPADRPAPRPHGPDVDPHATTDRIPVVAPPTEPARPALAGGLRTAPAGAEPPPRRRMSPDQVEAALAEIRQRGTGG